MALNPITGGWEPDPPIYDDYGPQLPPQPEPPPFDFSSLDPTEGLGPMNVEPTPNDFWSRVALGGGQFQPPQFNSQTPGGGLLALLALASGFAQGKTNRAARNISEVDERNARARQNASELAKRRWEISRMKSQAARAKENLANNQAFQLTLAAQKPKASEPLVQVMGPNGPTWARRSDAVGQRAPQSPKPPRPSTGEEKASMSFYLRGKESVDTLMNSDDPKVPSLESRIASLPLGRQASMQWFRELPVALTDDQQLYVNAMKAFTEARLRKESGAAIAPKEYEQDARIYFAQPGDKPATIKQKQRLRQKVLDGLKLRAGRAYDEYFGSGEAPGADTVYRLEDGELIPE